MTNERPQLEAGEPQFSGYTFQFGGPGALKLECALAGRSPIAMPETGG